MIKPIIQHPYSRVMRLDKPVGIWLVMWPGFWALSLASYDILADWLYFVYFFFGAVIMRSAGCVINDMWDRKIDAQVERTKYRPIASGEVSVKNALFLLAMLLGIGLLLLLQFNLLTIIVGVLFVIPIILYPLAKRYVSMPQAVLGLTINGAAIMGWTATRNELDLSAFLLFFGCFCWALAYDTIYAHQDKTDDAVIGIGSSALAFHRYTKRICYALYSVMILSIGLAAYQLQFGIYTYIGLGLAYSQLVWQVRDLNTDIPSDCLKKFKSNQYLGLIVFLSLIAGR